MKASAIGLTACALVVNQCASAQALPDSVLAQLRAGAARLVLPTDSTAVPMVGRVTTPTIEVSVNGHGPFRFLIDLGSNVTIVRKNVVAAARCSTLVHRARSDIVRLDSLHVGGARFDAVVAGAYDSLDVDGVIGYNLLRLSSFTLDYPERRFSLHRRRLAQPDNRYILSYQLVGRMPFLWVRFGQDSLLANLDTGASEWFTIPPAFRDSVAWTREPSPGPKVSNNQTGTRRVLAGETRDTLAVGPLQLAHVVVYLKDDADSPWLGSSTMQFARWTFDPRTQRVEILPAR